MSRNLSVIVGQIIPFFFEGMHQNSGNRPDSSQYSFILDIMDKPKKPPRKYKFDTKSPCPGCGERIGFVESTCPFCGDEIPFKSWLQLSNDRTGRVILGIALLLLLGYFFTIYYFWGEPGPLGTMVRVLSIPAVFVFCCPEILVLFFGESWGERVKRRK